MTAQVNRLELSRWRAEKRERTRSEPASPTFVRARDVRRGDLLVDHGRTIHVAHVLVPTYGIWVLIVAEPEDRPGLDVPADSIVEVWR
jgi:hypothetical protein